MTDPYLPFESLPAMLLNRARTTPDANAYGSPAPDDRSVVWTSWARTQDRVAAIAAGLRGLGIEPGDRVAIISSTRLEVVLSLFGVQAAGAVTAAIYPTTGPEDATHIMTDSGSRVLIAENADFAWIAEDTAVDHVVLIDGSADPAAKVPQLTLAELEEQGRAALTERPTLVEEIIATIQPDDTASLIYTSGTTGRPRGVVIAHRSWVWQAVAGNETGLISEGSCQYLWLPLSHVLGPAVLCPLLYIGAPTYVDGRVDKIMAMLPVVRPSVMAAAPRIYEKIYSRVVSAGSSGGLTSVIFRWAVATGKKKVAAESAGRPIGASLKARYALAERLVFSKLQARVGGKGIKLVSGSAPLSRDIAEFFAAAGLPIYEGYGLTETSGVCFVNQLGSLRIGTVGVPIGNIEVAVAEDGELLVRGASVMRGYHNLPDKTREAFTEDGFFRTGDIVELTPDRYLTITDRKKDLFKTSGGKYVAPSAIENRMKALCPYVSQAMVVAEGRNFASLLVTLDPDAVAAWAGSKPYDQVVTSVEANELIQGYVDQLNGELNRWETIKKFAILPRELTIEDGELTPSIKIKRKVVAEHFADRIDALYA